MIASRISKNGEALAKYGIDIKDTNGDLKSTYDILSELAPKWKEMSQEQQVSLGLTLAGTNQYKILSSTLLNFDTAINATNESLNASGATMKQNAVYMDSLEAKINAVKAQFTELVNEGGTLNKVAKGFLTISEVILKLLNTNFGRFILATATLSLGLNSLSKVSSLVTSKISTFAQSITSATTSTEALTIATKSLGNVGFAAVLALLPVIIDLVDKFTASESHAKENLETLNKATEAIKEQIDTYDESIKTLQKENLTREKLNQIIKNTIPQYEEELNKITDNNEARKKSIELIQKEREEEAKKITANKGAVELARSTEESYIPDKEGAWSRLWTKGATQIAGVDRLWDKRPLEEQIKVWEEYRNTLQKSASQTDQQSQRYKSLMKQIDYTNEKIDYMNDLHQANINTINDYEEAEKYLKATDGDIDQLSMDVERLAELMEDTTIEEYTKQIDGLQGALETATQAQLEYAENGMLTLDTFQSLLDIDSRYLSALVDENGQLAINESSVNNLVNALKQQKIEELQTAAAQDILRYATHDFANMSPLAQSAVNGLADTIAKAGSQALESAKDIDIFTESVQSLLPETHQIKSGAETKIVEAYAKLARQIADINVETKQTSESTKAYANAQKDATSATNTQTKALKAQADALKLQKEALQEEINDYKTVISYITDKINDHINSINDRKDAEIDAIEEQISELEDLADASDDYYDNEIQKLEDLRDLRDDLYADQIDQIKELQDQEKEYWNDKINALKEQNSELETQIEYQTLLENLAKAQESKKMVYREGKGFVYETDTESVNKARTELANFERKQALEKQVKELEQNRDDKVAIYQKQLDDLTKARELEKTNYNAQIDDLKALKEQQKEIYTEQINNLNKLKESVTESYNKQAQVFKDYLNKFKEGVNAYEQSQNRLKALQLTGIDFEAQGWQARLSNLNGFVSSYSNKLAQLANITAQYNQAQKAYESAQVVSASTTPTPSLNVSSASYVMTEDKSLPYWTFQKMGEGYSSQGQATAHVNDSANQKKGANGVAQWAGKWYVVKYLRGYATNREASSQVGMSSATGYYKRYASGVASVKGNQVALVGEAPNQELVFGSRANGIMTSLDNGAGVVNAQSTKTLAGIINQLSNYRGGNLSTITDNSSASNISIGTINLPNVTDGQSFVDYLQNFSLDMLQRAY